MRRVVLATITVLLLGVVCPAVTTRPAAADGMAAGRAATSWPSDGVRVMPSAVVALALRADGNIDVIGSTTLCPQPAGTSGIGLAKGVITRDGDVLSGNGSESIIDCETVGSRYGTTWTYITTGSDGSVFALRDEFYSFSQESFLVVPGPGTYELGYDGAQIAPAGGDLVFAMWTEYSSSGIGLFLRAVHAHGGASAPLLVTPDVPSGAVLGTDGRENALVAWYRSNAQNTVDTSYVQRFDEGGHRAWGPDGVPIPHQVIQIVADGAGGAYLATAESLKDRGSRTRITRLDADGRVHDRWTASGRVVSDSSTTDRYFSGLTADGQGGIFSRVDDHGRTRLLRIQPTGANAAGWGLDGVDVGLGVSEVFARGDGGAIVLGIPYASSLRLYYRHIGSDGFVDPGVPPALLAAPSYHQEPGDLLADGAGGAYASWIDYRDGTAQAYVGHIGADADVAVRPTVLRADTLETSVELEWRMARAGAVGNVWRRGPDGVETKIATVTADDSSRAVFRDSTAEYEQAYCYWLVDSTTSRSSAVACVTTPVAPLAHTVASLATVLPDRIAVEWSTGEPGFAARVSRRIGTGAWSDAGSVVVDEQGIARFTDRALRHEREYCYRLADASEPRNATRGVCVTTPPAVIGSPILHTTDQAIDVEWALDPLPFMGRVLRADPPGTWREVASVAADSAGRVAYHDTSVSPVHRYCYRLTDADNPATASIDACAVTTAIDHGFSVGPSPTRGLLRVAYHADARTAADIAVYDVSGRLVGRRTHVPSAPGPQTVSLELPASMASGIYLVQVRDGGGAHQARTVLIR